MGLARSTFYAEPQVQPIDEARLVEQIKAVCAEWPAYGYRRVTRHRPLMRSSCGQSSLAASDSLLPSYC
jgi:hypothetical protein